MEKGVISGTAAHDMGQKWPLRAPFVGKWVGGYTAHDPIEDTERPIQITTIEVVKKVTLPTIR